ncbi:MAG: cadherin-like domain-containing protein, partial [Anaerolineae bacterium]|nr:cadherin-like domain-containing protein [Anaerolineae bacterium]
MRPLIPRIVLACLVLIGTVAAVVAQAPTVTDDAYTTPYNTALSVPAPSGLLANDTGFSASTHRLESYDPLSQYGGVVTVAADGSFTYTPRSGFFGLDTFSYTVRNGFGATVGVVSITVTPPPAVANDDTYTLTPHLTFVSPTGVLGNDTGTLTG